MSQPLTPPTATSAATPDPETQSVTKTMFGFWTYLMTDCILFATLFATYAVLRSGTAGGPLGSELFDLPFVLVETLLLLISSFTAGLAMLAVHARHQAQVLIWLGVTFMLGLAFLTLEVTEFRHLAAEGNSWTRSAFLSSFFTLVGTHGLHILSGLVWIVVLVPRIIRRGLEAPTIRRLTLFSMFWHFLDIVWIFIFTIVYLMGSL